jgi:L,D-transpeptidase YcbB
MPGVRLDRLLASTAIVLLLSAPTGLAFADPANPDADAPAADAATAPAADAAETPAPVTAVAPKFDEPAGQPSVPAAAATPAPVPATAAAPAAAPTPAATLAATLGPADAAVATELQNIANGKYDRIVGGKSNRTNVDAFYSGRGYAPIWITDGMVNDSAKAAIKYLAHVDADGLDPADYPVPDFSAAKDPAGLAEAELKLSASIITYAHHASVGRVHWSRVSPDISYNDTPPEAADVLAAVAQSKDIGATLAAYEPHAPNYLALKAKLAEIRAGKGDPTKPTIANGPAPKIGAQDDRVAELRDRLGIPGDGSSTYDKQLADAVKKFQQDHDLKPTGTLTPQTIEALNGRQPDRPTDVIIANMERWRWMPHDLGKTYVIVNLPDFTLRVMNDGKLVWTTKIVIGKPDKATPIMTAEMKYITVNPTWNVPPSIVNNEYLPALAQDPTVLERMGLRVSRNPDGSVHISQPPGDKNALGRIRFNFPNKFLVYQHDTPDKYMFAYEKRAFSHGCMRVYDPPKYAEVLLSLVRPGDGYTEDRIKKMYGPNETDIQFPTFIPVHITYQTAFVDDAGKLQFREDVYGRDKALLAILKGSSEERRIADVSIDHRDNVVRRQALAMPDSPTIFGGSRTPGYSGGRYTNANDGGGFFARLFSPFSSPPVPPRPVPGQRRTDRSTYAR